MVTYLISDLITVLPGVLTNSFLVKQSDCYRSRAFCVHEMHTEIGFVYNSFLLATGYLIK